MTTPDTLLQAWKADAEALRRRGALEQARLLDSCIEEFGGWLEEWEAGVDPEAAAVIEGCHPETIRRKVRRGELANIGTPGKILVPRGQLRQIPAGEGPSLVKEEETEAVEDTERVAPAAKGVASLTSIARAANRGRAVKRGRTPTRSNRR